MAHAHAHTPAGANKKRLAIVFCLTTAYLIAEVVGGLMTGSLALLADAGHMLTDVAGLGLALLAIKFAERPATPERTYGYYRVEILAALTNAVVLIGISLYILYEAWERFRNPPQVESGTMLVVAAIGLGINIAGIIILRKGSKDSLNMKGAYFEVLSDMLTSVGRWGRQAVQMRPTTAERKVCGSNLDRRVFRERLRSGMINRVWDVTILFVIGGRVSACVTNAAELAPVPHALGAVEAARGRGAHARRPRSGEASPESPRGWKIRTERSRRL